MGRPRGTISNLRAGRRRRADVKWEFMYASELTVGSYVKFQAGEFVGLYGWVIDQKFNGYHWLVAVSDRKPKLGGLYQWFKVTDVWLASHADAADEIALDA